MKKMSTENKKEVYLRVKCRGKGRGSRPPSLRHNKRHPQDDKRKRGGSSISGDARNKQNALAAKRRHLQGKNGILPMFCCAKQWVLASRGAPYKKPAEWRAFCMVETRGLEPMTSRM